MYDPLFHFTVREILFDYRSINGAQLEVHLALFMDDTGRTGCRIHALQYRRIEGFGRMER